MTFEFYVKFNSIMLNLKYTSRWYERETYVTISEVCYGVNYLKYLFHFDRTTETLSFFFVKLRDMDFT